jgi:endonuclease/exonuclease/phosphatase family metal-dependent hydrolase
MATSELLDPPRSNPSIRQRAGAILSKATWAYGGALILLLAGMEWVGERNWLLSFCLYLPIQVWILPLGGLVPAAVVFERRKLLWVHGACLVLTMGFFGGYKLGGTQSVGTADSLTVMTNNIGQSNHQSMRPFLQAEQPDIIAFQDAANRGLAYHREYPDRFVVGRGEFVLISKYPILSGNLVEEARWNRGAVAARFELSFRGNPLVVYSVHMPTPRPDFLKLTGLGPLRELLGRNRRRSDGRSYSESMRARVDLARSLAEVFRKETKPFIVVGDFNAPNHGAVYHTFGGILQDAFQKTGHGYGFTFPGVSSHRLVLFGPWLRLDYLFAGNGWKPVYCRVEPHRSSQHRAVVARFEPLAFSHP